jgi:hypothetical protein
MCYTIFPDRRKDTREEEFDLYCTVFIFNVSYLSCTNRPFAIDRSLLPPSSMSLQESARKYVSALLSPSQAKPGDRLPVIDTVKETDATAIKLTPTGKNIFVRLSALASPLPYPTLGVMFYTCDDGGGDAQALTDNSFLFIKFPFVYEIIGWRPWSFHTYVPLAGAGIHREV